MRLITLLLALVIVAGLVVYNKNALLPGATDSKQTVKEQAKQIIDNAKSSASDIQKQMEQEQKRLEQYSK
ncbi:MAG: hypothetical protein GC149_09355 [Gammaproteobacteria bacterium]|nr:hypothetical protein [Gammaproteobacteria bacterium]